MKRFQGIGYSLLFLIISLSTSSCSGDKNAKPSGQKVQEVKKPSPKDGTSEKKDVAESQWIDQAKQPPQEPDKIAMEDGKEGAKGATTEEKQNPPKEKKKLTREEVFSPQNIARTSEAYGHFTYKSLDNPVLKLDFNSVVKGLNDAKSGKPSPMTEQEFEEVVQTIQEYAFQDMAAKNLKEAEAFLAKNAKEKGVKELEPGKLQCIIVKEGTGEEVKEDKMIVLHYKGAYADGKVFGNSFDGKEPVSIILTQTIPGFRKGILGMKVGETRRLFIHPELGYGTSGQLLPNALLIFDIEVVRLDPLPAQKTDGGDDDSMDDSDDGDDDDSTDNDDGDDDEGSEEEKS